MASLDSGHEDELVWLLRHRTRRRIILAIGDAGRISATALRDTLRISTGSLYYNLRQLRGFVAQDHDRNYLLTDDGLKVYKALKERGTVSSDILRPKPPSRLATTLSYIFFPLWLYMPLYENLGVTVSLPALSFALSAALLIYTRKTTLLLHFYNAQPNPAEIVGRHILNILILYVLICALSILFSGALFRAGREGERLTDRIKSVAWGSLQDEAKFLLALLVAILPLMLFPAVTSLDKLFSIGLLPPMGTPQYFQVKDAILIIAQGLTLPFLTALTAYGRRLNAATAALVVLLVFFVSHTLYQLTISYPT